MTKKRILIVFLTAVFLFTASLGVYLGILCYRENQRRNIVYTFDEITQDKAKDVDYIFSTYHTTDEAEQEFFEKIQNQEYKRYYGDVGSVTYKTYDFYDDNDNFLFRIMSWGNGERLCISFDSNAHLYKGDYYMSSDYWEEE